MFIVNYQNYFRCGYYERHMCFLSFESALEWIREMIEKSIGCKVPVVEWYDRRYPTDKLENVPSQPGSYRCSVVFVDNDISFFIVDTNYKYKFYKNQLVDQKPLKNVPALY